MHQLDILSRKAVGKMILWIGNNEKISEEDFKQKKALILQKRKQFLEEVSENYQNEKTKAEAQNHLGVSAESEEEFLSLLLNNFENQIFCI